MFYIEGLGNDGRLNPFDAETHIVYKGKEYAENSLTGNSIRNKDAYEAHTEYKVTRYYFHITEEYILSLPEVPLTDANTSSLKFFHGSVIFLIT